MLLTESSTSIRSLVESLNKKSISKKDILSFFLGKDGRYTVIYEQRGNK